MDLHGVDMNLLVAFDALMVERSVTRAGARVGRTQPAMSASLARLRTLLDDQLFVRGRDGLQPTQRAVELAEPLRRALEEIERTLSFAQAFDPARSKLSLRIAFQEHAAYRLMPRLLACLHEHAPATKLDVCAYTARDDAISLLDAGKADLAVGVPPTTAPGRVFTQALFEEPFVCVVRRGHPATRGGLDRDTFLSLDHLLVSPEGDRFGHTDTALAELGLRRSLALTMTQMHLAPSLVAASDLVATLMQGVVDLSGLQDGLKVFEPPFPLEPCRYVMAWHRRNDTHPAQRWLRQCVAEIA